MKPKYENIKVKLIGEDGNAFAILGRCMQEMRRAKLTKEEIENFKIEATAGDYNHLLATVTNWFEVK